MRPPTKKPSSIVTETKLWATIGAVTDKRCSEIEKAGNAFRVKRSEVLNCQIRMRKEQPARINFVWDRDCAEKETVAKQCDNNNINKYQQLRALSRRKNKWLSLWHRRELTLVDRSWDVRAVILKRDAVRRTEFLVPREICVEICHCSRGQRGISKYSSTKNDSVRKASYAKELKELREKDRKWGEREGKRESGMQVMKRGPEEEKLKGKKHTETAPLFA